MAEAELVLCPFCGGKSVRVPTSTCSGHIACIGECGMKTAKFWDEPMTKNEGDRVKWYEVAAEKWNRRDGHYEKG